MAKSAQAAGLEKFRQRKHRKVLRRLHMNSTERLASKRLFDAERRRFEQGIYRTVYWCGYSGLLPKSDCRAGDAFELHAIAVAKVLGEGCHAFSRKLVQRIHCPFQYAVANRRFQRGGDIYYLLLAAAYELSGLGDISHLSVWRLGDRIDSRRSRQVDELPPYSAHGVIRKLDVPAALFEQLQ